MLLITNIKSYEAFNIVTSLKFKIHIEIAKAKTEAKYRVQISLKAFSFTGGTLSFDVDTIELKLNDRCNIVMVILIPSIKLG